jgi:dephospho-CoA kinase
LVIALAGPTASNKTAIAEHAVANHGGWAWASCGAYVRSVARERGLATDLLSTHDFGQQLVDQMGAGAFLDAVIQHADLPSQVDTLVIDDIYHLEVFDALKERWDDLRFVSIDLPEPLRRRMMMEDRHLSAAQIAQVERTPLALAANRLLARHRSDMLHLSAGTVEQVSELSDKLFALASTA